MLTPEDLQGIANDITNIYFGVEKECVKTIVDHIMAGKRITQASVWQMKKLNDVGMLKRNLVTAISKQTQLAKPQVEKLIEESLAHSVGVDVASIKYATRAGNFWEKIGNKAEYVASIKNSEAFQKILKSTTAGCYEIMNLTGTKALQASVKSYTDAINIAYLEMATGNYTYEEAVAHAVGQIGKSGIKIVEGKANATNGQMVEKVKGGEKFTTYASKNGVRIYPLDSAIRRDLTTTINRSCAKLTIESCDDMGTELVETSWHVGARPEHEVWQGRIFSLNPKDTRYPYFYAPQEAGGCGYGDMLGICGINCYHSFNPYFEGSPRSTQANKPTAEENAKAYKEQQTQRAYERNLRSLKREQMAYQQAGLTDKAQDAQRRVNDMSHRYRQFLNDTGRTRISMLDKVSGYKRISTKAGATIPSPTALQQPVLRRRTAQARHVAPSITPEQRHAQAKSFERQAGIDEKKWTHYWGENWKINSQAHDYHSKENWDVDALNKLSRDEYDAIHKYSQSYYDPINTAMWHDTQETSGYGELIKHLDKGLDNFEVKEDVICFRGATSYEKFARQFGLSEHDMADPAKLDGLIGQTYREKGFTSLAGSRDKAWEKQVKTEVCVPKGTKGLYISAKNHAISYYGEDERELLIKPSEQLIIGWYRDAEGKLWFKTVVTGHIPLRKY